MIYDVVIIGAGSMGMSAGYYLSRANLSVALIDKYHPPHSEGSHHGMSRLIRHAYGEGEDYVPLELRSQALWYELEEEARTQLFLQTGVLNIGAANTPFLQHAMQSAQTHALPVDILTNAQINQRWPGYAIPDNLMGCFEANSGVLMSEQAIDAMRTLAVKHGSDIYPNAEIQSLESNENGGAVHLKDRTIAGKHLIITAGKGTNEIMAHFDKQLPISPVRKTFSWFHADESLYNLNVFPAWAFDDGDQTFYGFPSINQTGVKIGRHDGGQTIQQDTAFERFGAQSEDITDPMQFAQTYLTGPIQHKEGKVCTYSNSPDGDFTIDRLPGYQNVIVACGFSGHGYKFSTGIGEALAQMILDGKPKLNMARFELSRF